MSAISTNNSHLLQSVLSDPKLLRSFETYLHRINAHQNLLFIEAMSQLRYDYSKTPEVALKRYLYIKWSLQQQLLIWLIRMQKSFFSDDSKLALSNITTKEKVNTEIEDLQWAIIRREDAVAVLIETEEQVLEALVKTSFSATCEIQIS